MESITGSIHWEKLPEWFTGIATVLLVVVTWLLVRATKLLARIGHEEGRLRKIELTTTAWMRIRSTLNLPNLTNITDPIEIENKGNTSLESIRTLESFAACVNSDAYDIHTFNKISGAWFLQHFRRIEPYIEANRNEAEEHPPYDEIVNLQEHIQALRSRTLPPRERDIGMATADQSVNHPFFKTRMEALSDGVFAVALTLLVVDIATTGLPKLEHEWWYDFWPKAVSFVYSFLVVSMYWVVHHNEFNLINGATRELMWCNIFFLLFIVFIPFSAALLGSNWQISYGNFWYRRIPIFTYSANLILAGAALQATWLYASHRAYLLRERVDRETVAETTKRNLVIPLATVIVSFVALISVEAGQWLIVTVPISYVIWTLWAAYQIRRRRRAKRSLKHG